MDDVDLDAELDKSSSQIPKAGDIQVCRRSAAQSAISGSLEMHRTGMRQPGLVGRATEATHNFWEQDPEVIDPQDFALRAAGSNASSLRMGAFHTGALTVC